MKGDLAAVVTVAGAGLVASAPGRPAQSVGGVTDWLNDQGDEQALDLVTGEGEQSVGAGPVFGWGLLAAFEGRGDGEEGVGEQGEGDPAVPGVPAVSGLVHHEHGLLVRQMLQHVAAQVVAEQVGVPLCPPEQVLQPPVRGGVPDVLDYGPAVLARQVREQSKDQVLYLTPAFNPREAARDPLHQALE